MNSPFVEPISQALEGERFVSGHINVANYYVNVNLEKGPAHWDFKKWDPVFKRPDGVRLIESIGKGRFSEVFSGRNAKDEKVAIKVLKMVNPDRVRREIKILLILKGHSNIITLKSSCIDSRSGIVSLITPFYRSVPFSIYKKELNEGLIRSFMFQLLSAIEHAHSNGIMHRDIKIGNILWNPKTPNLILLDWGLSEFYHPLRHYSPSVGTPGYKAPEILLGYTLYDYSIDIWSAGVVLVYLLSGCRTLFVPKPNEQPLGPIVRVFGSQAVIEVADQFNLTLPEGMSKSYDGSGLSASSDSPLLMDLLTQMLQVNPKKRISASLALQHPFFADAEDPL